MAVAAAHAQSGPRTLAGNQPPLEVASRAEMEPMADSVLCPTRTGAAGSLAANVAQLAALVGGHRATRARRGTN